MAIGCIRRLIHGMAIFGIVLFVSPLAAASSPYGRGTYGDCPVQKACVVQITTVTTSSDLSFSINLTDGQVIPRDGYAITVTPDSTSGVIDHVDIYLADLLTATVQPGSAGMATWQWNPLEHPGTRLTIVVTATDGQTASRSYTVSIADALAPGVRTGRNGQPSALMSADSGNSPAQLARRLVHAIPPPVARSVPYILLLVLLANLVLLGLQLWRELREYRLAKRLLQRQRDIASDKHVLIQLVSHYLRTPMTLLVGGADVLPAAQQVIVSKLCQSLSAKVERLIMQASETAPSVPAVAADAPPAGIHFWRRPALFLPILLVGGLVVMFDYLAQDATRFSVSQTNLLTQLLVFVSLVLMTYFAFRSMQLRRRDARELERIAQAEAAVAQAGDEVVSSSAILLQRDIMQLGQMVPTLPAGEGTQYITDGYNRLRVLLDKVRLAVSLRGTQCTDPVTRLPFRQLLDNAAANVTATAKTRHITLPEGDDTPVATRSPELLGTVVASLLDNAVAYGAEGTAVEAVHITMPQGERLAITDHGVGIPESRLHDLFLPFQKLEGVSTFDHEGMGLSLYLDRLIMKYLGGSMFAETPSGGGTRIVLELPAD
jgi:signal transduction histidine kinase